MLTWYIAAYFTLANNAGRAVPHETGELACQADPDHVFAVQVSTPTTGLMRVMAVPCDSTVVQKSETQRSPNEAAASEVPSK